MISIKNFISERPDKLSAALVRVPYAMLEALGAHSVKCDPADFELNRAAMHELRNNLEAAKSATDVLQTTGTIVRTIETYNRRVVRLMEARAKEMNTLLSQLTAKLQELAEGNGASAENLRRIGTKLEKAKCTGDVGALKKELTESLQEIQQEAVQQKKHAAAIRTQAGEITSKLAMPANAPADSDPVTGLPGTCSAELAIKEAIGSHVHAYGVLFTLGSGPVTRRFGDSSSDEALATFARQIASNLHTGDLLFRWKGPTLLALLERPDSNDAAPPDMNHLSAYEPEFTVEANGKSTKIRLTMSSISFRLWQYDTYDAVRQRLDQCQDTVAPGPVQEPGAVQEPAGKP